MGPDQPVAPGPNQTVELTTSAATVRRVIVLDARDCPHLFLTK